MSKHDDGQNHGKADWSGEGIVSGIITRGADKIISAG
jgi:hypothetical protein